MESSVQFLFRLWAWFCELNVYTVYQSRFFQSTPGRCYISLDISFKLNSPFISPKLICEHVNVAWQVAWLLPLSWRPCKLLQITFCLKNLPFVQWRGAPFGLCSWRKLQQFSLFLFRGASFSVPLYFQWKNKMLQPSVWFGRPGHAPAPKPQAPVQMYFSTKAW